MTTPADLRARVAPPRGVIFDIDGTLLQDGRPLPGASRALAAVRAAGLPLRLATNTSRKPRSAVLADLVGAGLAVEASEVLTAPAATAAWLRAHGLDRVALLLPPAVEEDFAGLEADRDAPRVVVVGDLGRAWDYEILDRALAWLLEGAELVAIHRNRTWRTGGGLHLDVGPFVAALEYASGRRATVIGKPARAFFELAAGSMGLEPAAVAVVGDDLEADVFGAMDAGAAGLLVRTGKFREEDLSGAARRPDGVLGTVGDVAALVAAAGGR
ncbi:MAG TPA: HAD-IIA family hydrolase [Gemmatimonadota bacterium]|nr:HAD-IIA family hydrolase [Gemmatimonadota bacterium]